MFTNLKTIVARTAGHVSPRIWAEFDIARKNRHFEPEFWLLPQLCAGVETAVDVGGNEGLFSYYMAKHAQTVHTFEPNPICLAQMRRMRRPNITVHPVALSRSPGELVLRYDPGNTGIGTIEAANRLDQNAGIRSVVEKTVSVRTLDSFGLSRVGFIKIDVEGHEAAVVAGALLTITEGSPVLLIESELRHNPNAFPEVEATLASLGYSAWCLVGGRLERVTAADLPRIQRGVGAYVNNFLLVPPERLTWLQSLQV